MNNKTIDDVTIICPYIFLDEIKSLQDFLGWELDVIYEQDTAKIGSDLMYQKLWNSTNKDIFIMHADMSPLDSNWLIDILSYVNKYKDVGMFGCKLLYPVEDQDGNKYIQSAGGYFDKEGVPQHYGSGLDVNSGYTFKDTTIDKGQYDFVREVAWTTFGGVYIRREVLDAVGDFDSLYEWSYNRDVDYCLSARSKGWKIYQIPVTLNHYESKDNKRLRASNPEMNNKEQRNLVRLKNKWKDAEVYKSMDIKVDD